jgi:HTH-type transcriptional regulator/antitoxin HipB
VHIRSTRELGLIIRDQRRARGLRQEELAQQIGVSRQWIVAIEHGKPRADIGLVLRTLNALGLALDVHDRQRKRPTPHRTRPIDLNTIIESARAKRQ